MRLDKRFTAKGGPHDLDSPSMFRVLAPFQDARRGLSLLRPADIGGRTSEAGAARNRRFSFTPLRRSRGFSRRRRHGGLQR
jgi:hypothetical protein